MKPKLVNIYKFHLCRTLLRRRESNPGLSALCPTTLPTWLSNPPYYILPWKADTLRGLGSAVSYTHGHRSVAQGDIPLYLLKWRGRRVFCPPTFSGVDIFLFFFVLMVSWFWRQSLKLLPPGVRFQGYNAPCRLSPSTLFSLDTVFSSSTILMASP